MGLRLLGPPELFVGRRSLKIGGPRQRVALTMLALNVNRVTPIDQLVGALWDTAPPSTARAQIQTCISGLRKLFGDDGHPGSINTCPPGYLLRMDTEDLDTEAFANLVATARVQADCGRLAEAAATLREALGLWRGPALAGVDSGLVQRGAAVFEDSRLAAIEERVRLDLALGRHEEISSELAALVEEHPLRERLTAFRMLALYRTGRQADALEAGRRIRELLVAELAIEPGQELQNLSAAILRRDPALDLGPVEPSPAAPVAPAAAEPPPVPRQLPASIADFTGREGQLAEIRRILTEGSEPAAASYAVPIVAIFGKGGVGKSSLAVRAAHELAEFFPDGHLYGDLRAPGGEDDRTATLLVSFLHALGVHGAAVPDDPQERARLYRSMVAGKRVLVVLDDVTTEDEVLPLLPGSASCAMITTSRMRLSGLSGAHWIAARVFDTDRSTELLARIVGQDRVAAEPGPAVELVNLCGGLPLALRIAGARLAARPHWRLAALVRRLANEAGALDELSHRGVGLRFTIDLSYRALPEQARRLFRLFAIVRMSDFPLWTAAALLDTGTAAAEEVLESLIDAQLVDTVEYPGERIRYRLHNLIRIYALERLLDDEPAVERERALGRVLGAWLALTEDAHRQTYGGDYTVLHGTAPRWRPPGCSGAVLDDPMGWWDSERDAIVAAVRRAAAAGLDELCWDLALTSVTLFEAKGYHEQWRETTQLALEVAERAGNRTGRAAMLYSLGGLHVAQKRLSDAARCLGQAHEIFHADGNAHGRALVLRLSAFVDRLVGDPATMLTKYTDALATMRAVGDRVGEAQILRDLAAFRIDEGETEVAEGLLGQALAICREVGCARGEAQVLHRIAYLHQRTDQMELAREEFGRVLGIFQRLGDRMGEIDALYCLGVVHAREGRLDHAESTLATALSLAERFGDRLIEGQALYALGELGLTRGQISTGEARLVEANRLFTELGSNLWQAKVLILHSGVHARRGDGPAAGELVERARNLLSGLGSQEAARLLLQLDDSASRPAR